jgi:hypothetical protein
VWALRSHVHRRREWPRGLSHLRVIRLRRPTDVARFLDSI